LEELDALVGLGSVKTAVRQLTNLLQIQQLRVGRKLPVLDTNLHVVFSGNPGTGKTTVARLLSRIYEALGVLSKGQLVEADRSMLVAGYVGQTAMKTAEVCAKATGGVLFIDEAYALTGDQYAEEAVNTLVKEMEDRREELVVIVAGYPDPMVRFIAQNPGLASRFTTTIEFDDYSDEELLAILDAIAAGSDYELTAEARTRVGHILQATPRTSAFGNGRFSRNLFEQAVGRHAWRLKDATEPTRDDLRLLTADDFTEQPDEPVETQALEPPEGSDPVPLRADPDGPEPADEAVSDEQTVTSEDTR
jgi:SpoVK/Ycf46/Vps4 family AAA+-type ATPase